MTPSKPRRAYGEGAITERTRGDKTYFVARVSGGYDAFGSRVRLERWCATRPAAKKALSQLEEQVRAGSLAMSKDTLTLGDYLEAWLASIGTSGSVKKSTHALYALLLRTHVLPIVKDIRLGDFDVKAAIAFYKRLERDGKSASTRKKAHAVLSAALADAVPHVIPHNPIALVPTRQKPKYHPKPAQPYSLDEIRTFLKSIAGSPNEALYIVAIFSQVRRSEIFALERSAVSADCATIYIETAKTAAGRRRIDLPAIASAALADHLAPASLLRRKASANPLVFPSIEGKAMDGRNFLRRELYPAMERAKLRRITFHDLRHSGAMLIASQVPLTVLRERLGHTSESTTLIYAGHRSPSNQKVAVEAFDAIFPTKIAPKRGEIGGKAGKSRGKQKP